MNPILSQTFSAKRPRFWVRQFAPIPTRTQDGFDITFAVVLPVLCLVIDPLVFKGNSFGAPLLEDYQLLAYLVCTIEMGLFLTWRTFRRQLVEFAPVFAGVFFAGAMFSVLVGVVVLPYSVIGLMFLLIGALGFTPFLTALVFFRNGFRALRANVNNSTILFRLSVATLSGVLVLGLPFLASIQLERSISASVDTVIAGNVSEAEAAEARLKWFRFIPFRHSGEVATAYSLEVDPAKRDLLRRVYKNITGEDIEAHRARLTD
jgi:hypothetical protein